MFRCFFCQRYIWICELEEDGEKADNYTNGHVINYSMGIMYVINFLLSVIPLDFLQTWVYVKNNRSMLATIIFHLFINIMQEKINMTPETKCIQTIFVVIAPIIILIPTIL